MTTNSPRPSPALLYGGALGVVLAIVVAAYFGFVVREETKAEQARQVAEKLTDLVDKAQEYVHNHHNLSEQKRKIEETTAKVKLAIPRGPIDITVGSYLDAKAKELSIEDLKWNPVGGIKPPSQGKDDEDRLATSPDRLKSSTVDVSFTARYKDALRFIRTLSPEEGSAPWPIEIVNLEIRRDPASTKSYKVAVNLTARYLYE